MLPPNNLDNSFIKPLTPGEVARLAVTERDAGTDVFGCVGYLLFSGEEKRSKKVVGTLAAVSQAPQRSLVCEKTNTRSFTVGTGVPTVRLWFLKKQVFYFKSDNFVLT